MQRWAPGATSGVTVAGGNGDGSAANQLSYVYGVALDSSDNVYVADTENYRVQRWATVLPTPTVLPGVGWVVEGNSGTTALQVPVTLSNTSAQTITAQWNTLYVSGAPDNQADPATDYTPASGTVIFTPGQTTASVTILVNGDTLVEPDEYIVVSFHDPTNANMGGYWGSASAASSTTTTPPSPAAWAPSPPPPPQPPT